MSARFAPVVYCCGLLVMGSPSLASAQSVEEQLSALSDSRREEFSEAIVLGKKLYEQGEYEVALRQLEKAYAILPLPEILYRRGLALEKLGRDAEAIDAFTRYLDADPDAPRDRVAEIERALERLRDRVSDARRAFVEIMTEPPGASVFVGDETTARALTPYKLEVNAAGETVVRLTKPGYLAQQHEVEGSAGKTLVLSVGLEPLPDESEPVGEGASPLVIGLGAGAGALALTSAAFFGVYAMNEAQVDELSDRTTERPAGYNALIYAQNRRAKRGWFSLAGAALLGSAALVVHRLPEHESGASLSIHPTGVSATF